MIKRQFTIVELLVILGIIVILVAMLFPALSEARSRAKCINLHVNAGKMNNIDCKKQILSYKEFKMLEKAEATSEEINAIARGELNINTTTIPLLKKRFQEYVEASERSVQTSDDLYSQWVSFTGNPQKLSKQQFQVLKSKGLIKELQFSTWSIVTKNPQGLTRDQFEALKEADAISFPVKETKVTETTKVENW